MHSQVQTIAFFCVLTFVAVSAVLFIIETFLSPRCFECGKRGGILVAYWGETLLRYRRRFLSRPLPPLWLCNACYERRVPPPPPLSNPSMVLIPHPVGAATTSVLPVDVTNSIARALGVPPEYVWDIVDPPRALGVTGPPQQTGEDGENGDRSKKQSEMQEPGKGRFGILVEDDEAAASSHVWPLPWLMNTNANAMSRYDILLQEMR